MEFLIILAILGFALGLLLTWVFGMIEVAKSIYLTDFQKVIGLIGMFFFPVVGTTIYYFIIKPKLEVKQLPMNEMV